MYLTKTKILSMLGTGYFLKIAKINSQQEKPVCSKALNKHQEQELKNLLDSFVSFLAA